MPSRFLQLILVFLAATGAGWSDDFSKELHPLLQQYCNDCHNDRKSKGGVNLARFTNSASLYRDPKLWETALRQVEERQMPPDGKNTRQPTQEERLRITESLSRLLDNPDPGAFPLDPGRTVVRRLSATEYDNTVRDLLAVDLRPAAHFPADGGGGGGFDNNADTLFVPPILLEKYLEAADDLLAAADVKRLTPVVPGLFRSAKSATRANLQAFARRAWRRPPSREDVDRLLGIHAKTRAAGALVSGFHSVNARKKAVLRRAATAYLRTLERPPVTFRLDVVEVTFAEGGGAEVRHFANVRLFPKQFQP
jgi:Holliday junction resolvase-like predicted endonuclease